MLTPVPGSSSRKSILRTQRKDINPTIQKTITIKNMKEEDVLSHTESDLDFDASQVKDLN